MKNLRYLLLLIFISGCSTGTWSNQSGDNSQLNLDKSFCATYSKVIIDSYIRDKIGFNGILLSDDLCMKALKGPYYIRAKKAREAGCDILLHCDANISNTYNSYLGAGFASKQLLKKIKLIKKSISNRKNA